MHNPLFSVRISLPGIFRFLLNRPSLLLRYVASVWFAVLLFGVCTAATKEKPKILVFTKTKGFRHDNIAVGAKAIKALGVEHGFEVDHSEDAALFTDQNLKQYKAVVFFSTTGDIFDEGQKNAFMRYIQAGNGFVGIHAASDTEYNWPWYGKMVGGYFMSHPDVQHADIHVKNKKHPATKHLPKVWNRKDEWYDFKDLNPNVKVLMLLDEKTYRGGRMGDYHPLSWYHQYDGGRVFYTALGHTKESFEEKDFLLHIAGGIKYAIGKMN